MTYDNTINPVFWVLSNFEAIGISLLILFFVGWYGLLLRWWEHGGGRLVMLLMSSFLGVIALVVIGVVSNPIGIFAYPEDTVVWRPALRFLVYLVVAYALLRMDITIVRRWREGAAVEFGVQPRRKLGDTGPIPELEYGQTYPPAAVRKLRGRR